MPSNAARLRRYIAEADLYGLRLAVAELAGRTEATINCRQVVSQGAPVDQTAVQRGLRMAAVAGLVETDSRATKKGIWVRVLDPGGLAAAVALDPRQAAG